MEPFALFERCRRMAAEGFTGTFPQIFHHIFYQKYGEALRVIRAP